MGWFDFLKKKEDASNLIDSLAEEVAFYEKLCNDKDSMIKSLQDKLMQQKKLYIPKVLGSIGYSEALKVFEDNGINTDSVELSDLSLSLTSVDEAKKAVASMNVANETYVSEQHDCENFSFALLGYFSETLISFAFGTARSKPHRFNVMIDDKKQLWVCEPQTNQWWLYKDIKKNTSYVVISVLM